jgi:hypothetical protein
MVRTPKRVDFYTFGVSHYSCPTPEKSISPNGSIPTCESERRVHECCHTFAARRSLSSGDERRLTKAIATRTRSPASSMIIAE